MAITDLQKWQLHAVHSAASLDLRLPPSKNLTISVVFSHCSPFLMNRGLKLHSLPKGSSTTLTIPEAQTSSGAHPLLGYAGLPLQQLPEGTALGTGDQKSWRWSPGSWCTPQHNGVSTQVAGPGRYSDDSHKEGGVQ